MSEFQYKAIGYHGCFASTAAEVDENGVESWSESSAGGLGPGLYFWDNDHSTGRWWARQACKGAGGSSPGLLKALISLDDALDLTNVFGQNALQRLHKLALQREATQSELDALKTDGMSPLAALIHLVLKKMEEQAGRSFSSIRVPVHTNDTHNTMQVLSQEERDDGASNGDAPELGLTVGFRMVILVLDKNAIESIEQVEVNQ